MGDKGTYARRLKEIADACNTDENGEVLPLAERKIIYPGYEGSLGGGRNGKVYYSHTIADDEMDFLIKSIKESHDFTKEEKESFEMRLKEALKSKNYQYPSVDSDGLIIKLVDEPEPSLENNKKSIDTDIVERNISLLRHYIRNKKMIWIEIDVTKRKPKTEKFEVSPYRIVYSKGFWWLIANWHERPGSTCPYISEEDKLEYYHGYRRSPWYSDDLTAFRCDLICDISQSFVPDYTPVHTGIPKVRHFYYRDSVKNSERKARYNEEMKMELRFFDNNIKKANIFHLEDITYQKIN